MPATDVIVIVMLAASLSADVAALWFVENAETAALWVAKLGLTAVAAMIFAVGHLNVS